MGPFVSLVVGALVALVLTNVVWFRAMQRVRVEPRRALAESRAARAELVSVRLALIEALRPNLARSESLPSSLQDMIDRLAIACRVALDEVHRLRSQLGASNRRLASLQREAARFRESSGDDDIHRHLAEVTQQRDDLADKVTDLSQRVKRSQPDNSSALRSARFEIERLREQLRSANQAIVAMETAPSELPWLEPSSVVEIELEDDPTEPSEYVREPLRPHP